LVSESEAALKQTVLRQVAAALAVPLRYSVRPFHASPESEELAMAQRHAAERLIEIVSRQLDHL
jgi:hypothetical protein